MTKEVKIKNKGLGLDLDKLVGTVRSSFGKDKSRAAQISTGAGISRPTDDDDYVCWPNSPWEQLTNVKGIAFGRCTMISGKTDSGKSTHAMQFMKLAQDQNILNILVDTENKFSAIRFEKYFGGDASQIMVASSRMIIEGADEVEKIIHAAKDQNPNIKILVTIDSIGGGLTKAEGEDSLMEGRQMAQAAKENAQILRAFIRLMEKYKNRETNKETIAVLLINQTYASFNSPGQIDAGGAKVSYYSSLIVQLSRKADLHKTRNGIKIKYGISSRAKVKKNHLADNEESIAELDLMITAGGIELMNKAKIKKDNSEGWENNDEGKEIELEDE